MEAPTVTTPSTVTVVPAGDPPAVPIATTSRRATNRSPRGRRPIIAALPSLTGEAREPRASAAERHGQRGLLRQRQARDVSPAGSGVGNPRPVLGDGPGVDAEI